MEGFDLFDEPVPEQHFEIVLRKLTKRYRKLNIENKILFDNSFKCKNTIATHYRYLVRISSEFFELSRYKLFLFNFVPKFSALIRNAYYTIMDKFFTIYKYPENINMILSESKNVGEQLLELEEFYDTSTKLIEQKYEQSITCKECILDFYFIPKKTVDDIVHIELGESIKYIKKVFTHPLNNEYNEIIFEEMQKGKKICFSDIIINDLLFNYIDLPKIYLRSEAAFQVNQKYVNLCCSIEDIDEIIEFFKTKMPKLSTRETFNANLFSEKRYIIDDYIDHKEITFYFLTVYNLPFHEILKNLDKYTDLQQNASRVFYYGEQFHFVAHRNVFNRHLHPNEKRFEYMKVNTEINAYYTTNNSETYLEHTYDECEIYCSICHENLISIEKETLYKTKCGHVYHYECILKWVEYLGGERIVESKSLCPECRIPLMLGQPLFPFPITQCDFVNFTYYSCVRCQNIYSHSTTTACSTEEVIDSQEKVCSRCSIPRIGKIFHCPRCDLQLEHANGCNQFTCCRFGTDGCSGASCTHGSTDVVKFCGYRWVIKNEFMGTM